MTHVVQNAGFETAGALVGAADQWVSTSVATEELFADYDRNPVLNPGDTLGHESYEEGWAPQGGAVIARPDAVSVTDQTFKADFQFPMVVDLELATFGLLTAPSQSDGFETGWKATDAGRITLLWPAPQLQPDEQYVSVAGFGFADYNNGAAVTQAENFSVGWPSPPAVETVLMFFTDATDLEFSEFNFSDQFDSFDVGWKADTILDWAALETASLAEATEYGDGGPIGDFSPVKASAEHFGDSVTQGYVAFYAPMPITLTVIGTDIITVGTPNGVDIANIGAAEAIIFETTTTALGTSVLPVPLVEDSPYLAVLEADGISFKTYTQFGAPTAEDLTTTGLGVNVVHFNWGKYWTRELTA